MNETEYVNVEELDASNDARIRDIVTGVHGAAFQIPPGLIENIRTLTYLEALFPDAEALENARLKAAEKIGEMLTSFENALREAVIRSGGIPKGPVQANVVDLANVASINRHLEKK